MGLVECLSQTRKARFHSISCLIKDECCQGKRHSRWSRAILSFLFLNNSDNVEDIQQGQNSSLSIDFLLADACFSLTNSWVTSLM